MERQHPIKPKLAHDTKASDLPIVMMVSLLHLEELAVGYLWLQFDVDSLGAVQNYHRLLAILDLMTTIKPDEFHAWGLKTYMRYKDLEKKGAMREAGEIIQELHKAQEKFPENARGWYELAYAYTFLLNDFPPALEYARKALNLRQTKEYAVIVNFLEKKTNANPLGLFLPQTPLEQ